MRRTTLVYIALGTLYTVSGMGFASANPAPAALRSQDPPQQSLGDIARQNRKAKEERDKATAAPKTVLTDDNFPTGGASKADLARLDNPQTSPSDRVRSARSILERSSKALDELAPMDKATLAKLALQGREGDFPGRRAWEDKLFAAKEHYVSHGRELLQQTKEVLDELESLTSGGKISPSDPRAQELGHKATKLMQDASQTEADFQGVILAGQDLARQQGSH